MLDTDLPQLSTWPNDAGRRADVKAPLFHRVITALLRKASLRVKDLRGQNEVTDPWCLHRYHE